MRVQQSPLLVGLRLGYNLSVPHEAAWSGRKRQFSEQYSNVPVPRQLFCPARAATRANSGAFKPLTTDTLNFLPEGLLPSSILARMQVVDLGVRIPGIMLEPVLNRLSADSEVTVVELYTKQQVQEGGLKKLPWLIKQMQRLINTSGESAEIEMGLNVLEFIMSGKVRLRKLIFDILFKGKPDDPLNGFRCFLNLPAEVVDLKEMPIRKN